MNYQISDEGTSEEGDRRDDNINFDLQKICSRGDRGLNRDVWEVTTVGSKEVAGKVTGHIEVDYSDNVYESWRVMIVRVMFEPGEVHYCEDVFKALSLVKKRMSTSEIRENA